MAYETKENSGSMFRNDKKSTDNHPDYTGQARINGHDMWVSCWLKESRDGKKYFSLAFKQKDGSAPPSRGGSTPKLNSDFDSEVPF